MHNSIFMTKNRCFMIQIMFLETYPIGYLKIRNVHNNYGKH